MQIINQFPIIFFYGYFRFSLIDRILASFQQYNIVYCGTTLFFYKILLLVCITFSGINGHLRKRKNGPGHYNFIVFFF